MNHEKIIMMMIIIDNNNNNNNNNNNDNNNNIKFKTTMIKGQIYVVIVMHKYL